MQRQKRNKIIPGFWVLILAQILYISNVQAQSFDEARKLALGGERGKAREICQVLLSKGFDSDVALLLGRTYAWDAKYDSARIVFDRIRTQAPDNTEVLGALSDVEFWSGNYGKAAEYCDLALAKTPGDVEFILKKARVLFAGARQKEAVTTLEEYIRQYPGHPEAMKKLQEYRLDVLKNSLQLTYTYDYFTTSFNRDPWQIASLTYGRKTRAGTVLVRANLAERYGKQGFQFEAEAYPKFNEKNYAYLNYGFSSSEVFPRNRLGLEWYHNFPASFEGSVGIRTLFFGGSDVMVYTATVGKYAGNYWFSLRSFITPSDNGTSVSEMLQIRRYFSDPENYLGLRLGYGISPDDNRNLIDKGQKLSLKTRSVKLEYNHLFARRWILKTGAVWGKEEFLPKDFDDYFTLDLSLQYLF